MKLTFISDTHGKEPVLPGGDILFHTGDLTVHGFRSEIFKALNYLHEQKDKYKHVVLIPGNHDFFAERHPEAFRKACDAAGLNLLINESLELEGLKIWGSPATPWFHDWAFNYKIDEITKIWQKIPENLDILLTHGPPYGMLDYTMFSQHAGCVELRDQVIEKAPMIHAFGHIHEAAGTSQKINTFFINSAEEVININLEDIK